MDRVITENGRSAYTIVTSRFAHEAELYAASTLKEYLFRASGAVVPYFSDRCPKRSAEIRVGREARGKRGVTEGVCDDGFAVYTDGDDIVITAPTVRGVVYGVFGFLERFLGYRYFAKDCERIDRVERIVIPDVSFVENPAFAYRDVYFRSSLDCDFAVRNRLNSSIAHIPDERGGKIKFFNFHHSFFDLVPPDEYFADHPEYYSMIGGERTANEGQLCLTNEDVAAIATAKVKSWIAQRPDCRIFSVAQNDFERYCTCPECTKVDEEEGSPAGTVIRFVNRIAEEVGKEYPDVLIHTFAYQYSRRAPKHVRPRRNVIVRLCDGECRWDEPMAVQKAKHPESFASEFIDNINDWSKICDNLYIWDYNCNFYFYILPFPNWTSLQENLRLYRDNNVKGMLQQGNFAYGNASGLSHMQTWITSRMLWDSSQDIHSLIDEFCDGYFGKAGRMMRRYADLWENAVSGHLLRLYYAPDADFITDGLVDEAEKIFAEAFALADDDEVRRRLGVEYLSVRFLRIARMPMDAPGRDALVDRLWEDTKAAGITEIQERVHIDLSFRYLKENPYCRPGDGYYRLYYIMK